MAGFTEEFPLRIRCAFAAALTSGGANLRSQSARAANAAAARARRNAVRSAYMIRLLLED